MPTLNQPDRNSEAEFFKAARQGINRTILLAIAIIIILTVVAVTGVFFKYW